MPDLTLHWHSGTRGGCPLSVMCLYKCCSVWHPISPVPEWKKLTMPGLIRYWTKLTQSSIFLVRYQTEIDGCWNAVAGVSFLHADAQLWTGLQV
jgi:hypothetical protein